MELTHENQQEGRGPRRTRGFYSDDRTFRLLKKLAKRHHRTISGELASLIEERAAREGLERNYKTD